MELNFQAAIALLGGADGVFRIANEARPDGAYLLAQILPERNASDYTVESGAMTIRSLMAGMVGMDSNFPETGFMSVSTFLEQAAKFGNRVTIPEKTLRQIRKFLRDVVGRTDQDVTRALATEVFNMVAKVVVQPHLDTAEWLRGQALFNGAIDWTFNGLELLVDYGFPTGHLMAERTGAANYQTSETQFWADMILARQLLGYPADFRGITHQRTVDALLENPNMKFIAEQDGQNFKFIRTKGATDRADEDTRYTAMLTVHNLEGEAFDPANPKTPKKVQFVPEGKIAWITGQTDSRTYRVGEGSTTDPESGLAIGYTHVAPTEEGQGRPGRWSEAFVPEGAKHTLVMQGASNVLPVIEQPKKVVVSHTEIV